MMPLPAATLHIDQRAALFGKASHDAALIVLVEVDRHELPRLMHPTVGVNGTFWRRQASC
jgi:hypothetical protein